MKCSLLGRYRETFAGSAALSSPSRAARSLTSQSGAHRGRLGSLARCVAVLLVGAWFSSPTLGQGIITDGDANWEFTSTTTDGLGNFEADGTIDVLYQHWWWYRIEGETSETVLDPAAVSSASYLGNVLTLDWTTPSFTAQAVLTLTDDVQPNFATLAEVMTVTNTTGADLTLHLFPYTDLDVNGAGTDSATLGATDDEILVTDNPYAVRIEAVDSDAYQVTSFATLRGSLDDTSVTNLTNTGLPFGPGDFTGGFQWTRTIAPGDTETFLFNFSIEVLPCSLGVSGLACTLDCVTDEVTLSWTNGELYDEIQVEAGGVVSVLPGGATTFSGPTTGATYSVTPICGGLPVGSATCSVAPTAVTGLTCTADCSTGDVAVSWTNPFGYSEIEVEANGVVDVLPGSATSTVFTLPDGTYTITVTPQCGSAAAPAASCTVTILTSGLPDVVVWAAELPSDVDSVQAVRDALDALGVAHAVVDDISNLPCSATLTAGTLFAILGTYPDRHVLTSAEGTLLQNFVTSGGNLFVSGGDTWGFDAQTPLQTVDGVASATDGDDSLLGLTGLDYSAASFSGLSATYTQDQVGNDYTDRLTPATSDSLGPNAGAVWTDDGAGGGGGYTVGIYYDTTSGGKVFSQSFEFGGHNGDRVLFMERMIDVFGGTVTPTDTFRRGDTNNDGGFDISDVVFALGALFVPGSPTLPCADAGDGNDDGGFDVSDAVYMLSALFVPGSPPPPDPGPTTCGDDPTMDSLDCATSACP